MNGMGMDFRGDGAATQNSRPTYSDQHTSYVAQVWMACQISTMKKHTIQNVPQCAQFLSSMLSWVIRLALTHGEQSRLSPTGWKVIPVGLRTI